MITRRPDGVFVSSVYDELKEYRKAALDAVWRCSLYPIGMERDRIARPETPSSASLKLLDEATVYVGIFSQRYGRVTVDELRHAQDSKLPILLFFSEQQLNEGDRESDPSRAEELKTLKAELRRAYQVATFTSVEDLSAQLVLSLLAQLQSNVLMAGAAPTEGLPHPPTPFYAHPYIASGAPFVGRQAELALLDAWASASDPVLVVDAIGGTGKSALAWHWVHQPGTFPARKALLWWSFYESNASMGNFLASAVAYLTGQRLEDCARKPRPELEAQLLRQLQAQPVLLVLDGVERLLLAYHRLDAPHLSDAAVVNQPRACIDPRDGTLLRALTNAAPSKVLITTRLTPQDLQDKAGQLLQGVRRIELSGLRTEDALQLFAEMGVHGDPTLIRNFLAQFGDHALLIQALAGRVRDYRETPGDFDAWYQAVGRTLQLSETELVARQASVLQAALADLDPAVFRLLCNLAAFRYPVDYAAVKVISPFHVEGEPDAGLAPLHAALGTLEERGLVQWDRRNNRYDLHPVVRAYAYGKLEDKEATYAQVKSYFAALPVENTEHVHDVTDLRQTLELYHALLNSNQSDDAQQLYYDRLRRPLREALGTYATIVELLSPLFTDGFDQPPALHAVAWQAFTANELAVALFHLGDLAQAQRLYAVSCRLSLQEQDAPNLVIDMGALGQSLQDAGRLSAAERRFQLALALAQAAHEPQGVAWMQQYLINLYSTTGEWAQAEAAYTAVQNSPDEDIKTQMFTSIYAAGLRWGQGQNPDPLLEEVLRRVREQRFLYAEREAQRLTGEVACSRGDLSAAEAAWQEAYAIAQREGTILGPYLADLARLHATRQESDQARALITEALALGGQNVALAAVEVYTALGEPTEAKRYVDTAYREAWADGPPYAFYHELRRIRAVIQTLGIPEPRLPPFDPSHVQPIPNEMEIRAFIEALKRQNEPDTPAQAVLPAASMEPNVWLQEETRAKQNGKRPWWQIWPRRQQDD
jgi:tetratricopeptide (TPR) repeat protein